MSFRLLQYSDSHLGFRQYNSIERLRDFAEVLDEVLRVAIEMNVDAVVDTGDTFDSPNPDPYSLAAFRRFLEKLHQQGIQFLGIVGNHNRHEMQSKMDGASWLDAASDHVIRPSNPETPIRMTSRDGSSTIQVVAADWMPSSDIPAFLSRIPKGVDALFMHQSCERFLPAIAKTELTLSQIDGIASYVGVGDIHVTGTLKTQKGTIVGSAGSTEMASRGESPEKFVMAVTLFPEEPGRAPVVQVSGIETRGLVTFPSITLPEHIVPMLDRVRQGIVPGKKAPMVIVPFARRLQAEVSVAQEKIREMGVTIVRFVPETDVKKSEDMVEITRSGSILMESIIGEILSSDGDKEALGLALELWSAQNNAQDVINSYIQRIEKEYENQGD